MAVPFSNTKLRVPRGFQNVLWVFSREVIRDNPNNIYEYGSDFFDKLLAIRQHDGHDPAVVGAHAEDRFYNNWSFKKSTAKDESEQMEVADTSTGVPGEYAPFSETARLPGEGTATGTAPGVWTVPGSESSEEIDIDLTDPDVEDVALKIQAQFKGFKARKHKDDHN